MLCSFTNVDKSNIVDVCKSCIVDNKKISQRIKDIIDESYVEKDITKIFERANKLKQRNASYVLPTRTKIANNWAKEASSENKQAILNAIINNDDSESLTTLMKEWFANRVLNELCDLNIPNRPFAKTVPLCHAVGLQKPEYVKILLAQPGIDVNARDDIDSGNGNAKYYFTALHTASSVGNLELIKMLCEDPDIDILATDAYGKTALHWACHMGSKNDKQVQTGNLEIVKYFIDTKKLPVTMSDSTYRTPLHWASFGGNLEIVKYLICKITGLTEEEIASEDPVKNIEDPTQRAKRRLNIRDAISHTDIRQNTQYGLATNDAIKNLFKKLRAEYRTEKSSQKFSSEGYSGMGLWSIGGNKPRRSKKRKHSVKRNARNNKKRTLTHRSSKSSRI